MGLWDFLTGQFIDVIDWLDDSDNVMAYRFERADNEIKYGAMLTVRESQIAVFVNEGTIADVFPPGLYQLETDNLPVLSNLQAWPHGFESPFKAEVYFINTKQFTDLKWGTKNPIMLRDPEFGPVRLRAFGSYTLNVSDSVTFLKEIAGTDGYFTTEEITHHLRNIITSTFADTLANSGLPSLDLARNYRKMSSLLNKQIQPQFAAYGLTLSSLHIENISLPAEVETALDKRTSMEVLDNLNDYSAFQAAEAMTKAADNPSGDGAAGIGMAVAFGMADKIGRTLNSTTAPANTPPPIPSPQSLSYYTVADNKRSGPYDAADIQSQIAKGHVTAHTLMWHSGLDNWQPASDIPSIANLLAQVPPPLPG